MMSDQLSREQIEEITQALVRNNKIAAIKIYREATGQGLKESKEFIDALIPQLMEKEPEKFAHLSQSSGCAGMFLLALITILCGWGLTGSMDTARAEPPVKELSAKEEKREAKASEPEYAPIDQYEKMSLSGWQLIVHRDLIGNEQKLWGQVRQELEHQFYQIQRRVPAEAVKKLQRVPIWVELSEGHHPGLVYHPDPQWLSDHQMNPKKARCVEIANARNFVNWSIAQPYCVLHELAHAWHHQQLPEGFGNKEIALALEHAKQKKKYGPVLHINEKSRQAYAGTNPMEYFAESTEAFFGTNDFYPFVRSELNQYDPEMHELLKRIWGVQ